MEIPGIYSRKLNYDVNSFFNSRLPGEPQAQKLDVWRTWSGTEYARFIADVCLLPQYGDVAERNLSGAYVNELLQAGLLSKGLAKIGIGDYEHVQLITAAIQRLDFGGRLGMSLGCSENSWTSSTQPCRKPLPTPSLTKSASAPALPKVRQLKTCKPKLLDQVLGGFYKTMPEYQSRLASPLHGSLPTFNPCTPSRSLGPVVTPISSRPVNYVYDEDHSPAVSFLRKAVHDRATSEAAVRAPYLTACRSSLQPWNHGVDIPPSRT